MNLEFAIQPSANGPTVILQMTNRYDDATGASRRINWIVGTDAAQAWMIEGILPGSGVFI